MSPVAVVTGGSSGIGYSIASALAQDGYKVYELSRSGKDRQGVCHIGADIGSDSEVAAAVDRVAALEGRVDLLVNNAGYGISGAAELTKTQDVMDLFNVDFCGVLRCVRCCVPYMREAGGGRIINISSVAAVMPIPFQSFYSCVKSSVNTLTCALANELRPFNISVCALMPGDVRTGFTASRVKSGGEIYGGAIERAVSAMEKDEENGMPPESIAGCVVRLAKKKKVGPLYTAGTSYRLFVFLKRLLPVAFVNRILGKMYG